MQKSDLPFGSEFSPSQVDLVFMLELAKEHRGNVRAFEDTIRSTYFANNETNDENKRKLAMNAKLGMIAYGIIDRDINLTELGEHLYTLKEDEAQLYRDFARHILLNLYGATFIRCIQDIQASGETVTLPLLREWLEQRGIHFPRGGKHPSMMRLWLEKAGVFAHDWIVNEERLEQILGTSVASVEVLASFTSVQQAFIKTLANMGSTGPYQSNDVEKLASATYGVKFPEKDFAKRILYPLEDAGYITLTRGEGRGAKPSLINITEQLNTDIVIPLIAQLENQVGTELAALQRQSLTDILEKMKASDTYVRGLALEALAFKLMRFIDLSYLYTRLRGSATGGAEVDLLFESSRLVYSRWQIQCKNTERVALADVAKV